MRYKFFLSGILLLAMQTSFSQIWGINNTRTETRADAGEFGAGVKSGFFETEFAQGSSATPSNYPAGASGWWHLLDIRHNNPAYNFTMQFSGSITDQNLFFRKTGNVASTAWSKVVLADPNGVASASTFLAPSFTPVEVDRFNYNNGLNPPTIPPYSVHNYGLEWYNDSWAAMWGPTAYLSSFGGIKLFTTSALRMCITAGGNVGIGTANPQEKLSVDGTIASRRVRVTQNGWPDYVFEQKYLLRKLDAVESYITRHKHLPDVPSAAQIAKDGLDLGENQAVLLRKLEELTLYVIKLNKAVKTLQAENKEQKRINAKLRSKK